MKVHDVGSSRPASGPRRKPAVAGRGDAFAEQLREIAESSGEAPVLDAQAVSPANALLTVQEVPDSTEGRSRGLLRRYGDDILDRLDRIRHQVLAGAVERQDLVDLARVLRARKAHCDDPRLTEVIEAIELRAEVEIAKLSRNV
jgi:hypothetical protein